MKPEQKQRLEQIRERQKRRLKHGTVPYLEMMDDINDLLSLVKEQEAGPDATARGGRLEAQLQGVMNSLAISQQEVERLREGRFTPDELQNLCHNLNGDDKQAFFDGCSKYQEQLFGVSAATAMRSACVEKVKTMRGEWLSKVSEEWDARPDLSFDAAERVAAADKIINELESLSIEKQED